MREITMQEARGHWAKTGEGVDCYREFRGFVNAFVATIDGLKKHEPTLLHAWLVNHLLVSGKHTQESLRIGYESWQAARHRHRNVTAMPEQPKNKPQPITQKRYVTHPEPTGRKQKQAKTTITPLVSVESVLKCLKCGDILVYEGGRRPSYCSNSCKMKAYRQRQRRRKSVTKRNRASQASANKGKS